MAVAAIADCGIIFGMTLSAALLPVTVVVPVRNEAGTLPELFAALLRQSLKPVEVVFVDTGSEDDSEAKIDEWGRVAEAFGMTCKLVRLTEGYPGAARNAGVRAATQDWIAFIDAGIVPEDDWLAALWACQEELGKDAIFGVCHFVSGSLLGRTLCALSYGYDRVLPVLPASLFRRSLFDRVGFFEPTLRSGEDILWKRALAEADVSMETCKTARVEYRHFPTTLPLAARKWFSYERSATAAGIGGGLRAAALFGLLILYGLLIVTPIVGVAGLVAYALLRGVVDPLRRSGWHPWWGSEPWAVLAAVPVAAVLDLSAAAGRIAGLARGSRYGRF